MRRSAAVPHLDFHKAAAATRWLKSAPGAVGRDAFLARDAHAQMRKAERNEESFNFRWKNAPARFSPSSRSTAAAPLAASTDISFPTLRRRSRKMVEALAAAGEARSTTPSAPRSRPNRPPEGPRTRQADVAPDKPAPARLRYARRMVNAIADASHGRLVRRRAPAGRRTGSSARDSKPRGRARRHRQGQHRCPPPRVRPSSRRLRAGRRAPGWRTGETARRRERASRAGVGNRGQARRLPPERRHPVRQIHGQRRDVAPAPMPRASAKRRYLGESRLGQPDLPGLSEFGRLRGRPRLPPRRRRRLGATGRHRVPNRASPPR